MRRLVLATILLLVAARLAAQEQPRGGRYFGAPVLKYTSLRGQGAVMFGGRGGFQLSRSLVLGGGAYGTVSEVDAPDGADPNAPGPLDLKVETFGIDIEYAIAPAAATHPTLGASVGGGAAHYMRDGTTEQHDETDFLLLLEPVLGLEHRLAPWARLHASISYRFLRGVDLPGLESEDVRGASAALALKLGRF